METIAVIPARGGSKSIKNKNLKIFNGKPLIQWTIELAKKAKISRVLVSTDSEEIKSRAEEAGAEVPFLRDSKLATDEMPIEPVLADLLLKLHENESYSPDALVLLMPTSPFRIVSDVNDALKIYLDNKYTSVFSVSEAIANNNPNWMIKLDEENKPVMFNGANLSEMAPRRQELPKYYFKNDFVFVVNPNNLKSQNPNLFGSNPKLMITPEDRFDVDINTPKDWEIAEILFRIQQS